MKLRTLVISTFATVGLLASAGCAATVTDESSDQADSDSVTLITQPEDGGKVITGAIEGATKTVDIPIYAIGGNDITAALAKAKANGVAVRIIINGGYGSYPPAAQKLQQTLDAAPGSGTVKIQWSNNNFNVTHQKSVIVDASDENGNPLPANSLPSSAKVVISTGNFQEYGGPFWAARDFDMVTSDPTVVSTVATVFANDFSCPGPTTIVPSGLQAADRLVWSNGTTGFTAADTYPSSYPMPSSTKPWPAQAVVQGNGRPAYLDVITSAGEGDVLRFTNEELTDPDIVNALTKAATPTAQGGQGADVRIIMSLPKGYTAATASKYEGSLWGIWQIVKAGGTAHMFANNQDDPAALYIHGKMVAKNSDTAVVGSENAGFMSLNANRELGMNLTSQDSQAMGTLTSTFDKDWANGSEWVTVWTPQNVPTPPASSKTQPVPQANIDPRATGGLPLGSDQAQKCGPVIAPTKQ